MKRALYIDLLKEFTKNNKPFEHCCESEASMCFLDDLNVPVVLFGLTSKSICHNFKNKEFEKYYDKISNIVFDSILEDDNDHYLELENKVILGIPKNVLVSTLAI